MSGFRLYPTEQPWWSFRDYQAVLDVMARTGAKRVLEFGPGSSTLALVEGGADLVVACEDNPEYIRYHAHLTRFPAVRMQRYIWAAPLEIPEIEGQRFDLGLIDGPRRTENRVEVLRYCLERCDRVLIPFEEEEPHRVGLGYLRPFILGHAAAAERPVEEIVTGPLAGSFALIGPRA